MRIGEKIFERQKGNLAGDFADFGRFLDGKSWLSWGELWCVDGDFSGSEDMRLIKALRSEVRKMLLESTSVKQIHAQQVHCTIAIPGWPPGILAGNSRSFGLTCMIGGSILQAGAGTRSSSGSTAGAKTAPNLLPELSD